MHYIANYCSSLYNSFTSGMKTCSSCTLIQWSITLNASKDTSTISSERRVKPNFAEYFFISKPNLSFHELFPEETDPPLIPVFKDTGTFASFRFFNLMSKMQAVFKTSRIRLSIKDSTGSEPFKTASVAILNLCSFSSSTSRLETSGKSVREHQINLNLKMEIRRTFDKR